MTASDALPTSICLLRVWKDKPTLIHSVAGRRRPLPTAVEPTSEDRRHSPVRVSWWDAGQIAVERAAEIRAMEQPFAAFVLSVSAVGRIASKYAQPALRVVKDPEGAVGCTENERQWHYGMEGLTSEAFGQDKTRRTTVLVALRDECTEVLAGTNKCPDTGSESLVQTAPADAAPSDAASLGR